MLVAISMVLVLVGPVLACKAGEGLTAPWMDVLMPAQAMVCALTALLVCDDKLDNDEGKLELVCT